jgi:hypothetical protein
MTNDKKTGSRKLLITLVAMALVALGFAGVLLLSWLASISPNELLASYTTFVGAIAALLTAFVGGNAFVHAKGKDPLA